jgi:hypothetical protein
LIDFDLPSRGDNLHPIFVSFCGLISSHISLFKAFQEKQKVIQLEQNPEKPGASRESISKLTHHRSLSSTKLSDIAEY